MFEMFSRLWGLLVFRGAIAILFGVLAMAWPNMTLYLLVILWGAFVLVDGVSAIAMSFSSDVAGRGLMVVTGMAGLAAGIVALVWPAITAVVLLVVIAAWAVVIGVAQLLAAWRLRKEVSGEWLLAVAAIVSIGLGVVLLMQPAAGAVALVFTIDALATVWGLFTVLLGLRLRAISRQDSTSSVRHARPV